MSQLRNGAGVGVAGVPAPFLIKTHQMVEDAGTDDVISWNAEGSSFVVWKPVEFARDLLSKYFKHNNFSSFVRQLNTYGFRKVVPDRWEFANEHFKRGEQRLLSEIHRRKTSTAGGRSNGRAVASTSNSREDEQTSSSTSSTLQLPPAQQLYELSEENEKLRKDNQQLSSELALSKKHCEQLLGFLSKYVDVDKLDLLMMMKQQQEVVEQEEEEEDEEEEEEETEGVEEGGGGGGEQSLKLFGVWLKEEDRKKRVRCEMEGTAIGVAGRPSKKAMAFEAPWMEMSTPPVQGTSKVFHSTLPFLKQKG